MLDSGASVNLIPKALYDKYKFVELQPINVEVQLADGSTKKANGELINVMVRVEKCVFSADFIVAEIEVLDNLTRAPIIVGSWAINFAQSQPSK